jgi:hypothetical protein
MLNVYSLYHLICSRKTTTYCSKKNQKQILIREVDFPSLSHDTRVKATYFARPLLTSVAQTLCRCEHGVAMSRTLVRP